ncbi:hypothetical protein VCSRO82_3021 [Vibrio cholerae]|nr:hypothetical protein VCSRO82_3021 [Vibrio cholerae]
MKKLKCLFWGAVVLLTLYVGYKLTQYLLALVVFSAIGFYLYRKLKPKQIKV